MGGEGKRLLPFTIFPFATGVVGLEDVEEDDGGCTVGEMMFGETGGEVGVVVAEEVAEEGGEVVMGVTDRGLVDLAGWGVSSLGSSF